MKVRFVTLGCKLNFAESSALGKELLLRGHQRASLNEVPDVCVVNTCSVTDAADHKDRQTINQLHRKYPNAIIIVTGCYAQLQPQQIAQIEGVDYVLGQNEKYEITQLVDDIERLRDSLEDASLQDAPKGLQFRGKEMWREMTKHDINSIVCHAAQEYDANITSREVMTALQSDLIPDVHPLREYVLSCGEWTEEQPDWIDFVASQVRVADNASDSEKGSNGSKSSKGESAVEIARTSRTPSTKADTLWRGCFKKWFVAMVASWLYDNVVNHQVLVLIGRQGIFKTTGLENLIPPHLRDYCCNGRNGVFN